MKVTVELHHSNRPEREGMIYATVRSAKSRELLLSATLDYVLQAALERGYKFVEARDAG